MKVRYAIVLVFLSVCLAGPVSGCQAIKAVKAIAHAKTVVLTDSEVDRYCKAFRAIRELSPGSAEAMRHGGSLPAKSYARIVKTLAGCHFTPVEFMKVNVAVALAFSQIEGVKGMARIHAAGYASLKSIDKQLADPSVPASTKTILRAIRAKALQQIAKNQKQMATNDFMAKATLWVTHLFNDDASIAVVKRHHDEILAAYVGRKVATEQARIDKVLAP